MLHSALLSGFIVHLIPILVERGFTLDSAVAAFALFGPAQVGARLLMAATERRLSLRAFGIAITVLLAAAFLLLPAAPPGSVLIAAFCMLFGAANGTMTLLRAVLPPELFGRADYGVVQGMIAMPATFARAAGPFILAAIPVVDRSDRPGAGRRLRPGARLRARVRARGRALESPRGRR